VKIVLVSGVRHKSYIKHITKYTPVNVKTELFIDSLRDYLQQDNVVVDIIIITDGGLSLNPNNNIRIIEELVENTGLKNTSFVVLTFDCYLKNEINKLSKVNVIPTIFQRARDKDFTTALKMSPNVEIVKEKSLPSPDFKKVRTEETENKTSGIRKSFSFGGMKKKPKTESDDFSTISRAHSRVVAFTGRAGVGITSSVLNVAYSAVTKGMRVIVLDLDIEYRAANLYLSKFCTLAEESEDISRSLIRTLANPHNYMETAVAVADNFWVASLGYDFDDNQAIENFFTEAKVTALVSALKSKFDYVFVDIPLQALSQIPGTIIHFDNIALCVENNLYSAVTTLRTLINNFNAEDIRYLNMKSKLVITKYNDESMYNDEILTPERLAELMTDNICDDFIDVLEIAGEIPYMVDFDRQIERDVLIYETSSLMMKSYDKVLTRL